MSALIEQYGVVCPEKEFLVTNELKLRGIVGFLKREVTAHGAGAKVICPKEFLGKVAYLVIMDEE